MFSARDATDAAARRVSFLLERSACGRVWVQDVRCAVVGEGVGRDGGEEKEGGRKTRWVEKGVCVCLWDCWGERAD